MKLVSFKISCNYVAKIIINSPRTGANFHSLILFLSESVKYFLSFTCKKQSADDSNHNKKF